MEARTPTGISHRLRHLRQLLVGTNRGAQKAFARRAGVMPSTYSDYESRGVVPSAAVIAKIVSAYPAINSRWLLTGEGEPLSAAAAEESAESRTPQQIDLDLLHQLEERLKERHSLLERLETLEARLAELEQRLAGARPGEAN